MTTPATEDRAVEIADGGEVVAAPSVSSVISGVATALGQGRSVAREAGTLAAELVKVAAGRSEVEPDRKDKRFADPAWAGNPAYRRLSQSYLALAAALQNLVDELERSGTDWRRVEQARFAVTVLASAIAPTNTLWGNPAALKKVFDTAGMSLVRGVRNWWDDLRHNGGMPSQVDRTAFRVGHELALSEGAVVERDEVAELIQYKPATTQVRRRPLLIVPPPIGRFYFLDLRPERSFIEYAVGQGHQVFLLSWRNPQAEHHDWGLETYSRRILRALDATLDVSGSDDANMLGFCAGGILQSMVLNHLAEQGDERVHSAGFAVTLLDFDVPAPVGAFASPQVLRVAGWNSKRKGIITSREMGSAFSWMRPDDLVFNYVVNNYLLGEDPPAFDILAWNADGTNLPATLHGEFLDIFEHNTLAKPGALTVLGSPVHLDQIKLPFFVTGAIADHLTPWSGCYRTTELFSGESTFVRSNAGHVASLVNPPGNPKASYETGPSNGIPSEKWEAGAEKHTGSWWEAWAAWLDDHAGDSRKAPAKLGNKAHPPLDDAPGRFVRNLAP